MSSKVKNFSKTARPSPIPKIAHSPKSACFEGFVKQLVLIDTTPKEVKRLTDGLSKHIPHEKLQLTITDNSYTIVSIQRKNGLYRMRIHHMFLQASDEVIESLSKYAAYNDKKSSQSLSRFIRTHQTEIRKGAQKSKPQQPKLITEGKYHNLEEIYHSVNQTYFDDTIMAKISWGIRKKVHKPRNSIKLGSYSVEDQTIRIHPALDQDLVPVYFISWVVYHEMLHQKHDIPVVGGRKKYHTKAFLDEEKKFKEYKKAEAWQKSNLHRLLTS